MLRTFLIMGLGLIFGANAQNTIYWQQHAEYTMDVSLDVKNYQYNGTQQLVYTNNSPDTLERVYYHLYFNAFQPGSEMDLRLQTIQDGDGRMLDQGKSRIAALDESEMGYLHATSLTQDGADVTFNEEGTVLVVKLAQPIAPGERSTFDMAFKGQVPVMIRRSGRNSSEGVALSMSQWYPKMAEYDFEGWHPNPYIAREFHGVWGDFDVKITIDKDYTVGGTGYLQNADEIGHGYERPGSKVKTKGKTLTWHFKAPKVHDFMWAADPDYVHDTLKMENGTTLHFLYKNNPEILENWKKLQPLTEKAMIFFNKNIGDYPYKQYSVIQGGDGGMEYAMSTLITGGRNFNGLVSVMIHELAHSWFQHVLANNELKHGWMDEGFTEFVESLCKSQILEEPEQNPFASHYNSYFSLVQSGREQPLTTHADRYDLNAAYSIAVYSKGAIFLSQLGYVIGQDKLMEALRNYYTEYQFKHPVPNDFIRMAEKESGMILDWYLMDWTKTTNTIDYGIKEVVAEGNKTKIVLERIGLMPMPIDLLVVDSAGNQETFYIPLRMTRGEKQNPYPEVKRTVVEDWAWASPIYELIIDRPIDSVLGVSIDPSQLMADVDPENNIFQAE